MPTPYEPGAPVGGAGIPLSVPCLGGNEWRYVKECIDTGWVSSAGPFVDRFERELGKRVGAPFAVSTVTGTAALHIALLAVGVEPEDEVLVSTLTFIAPVNAIRYVGAQPVFMDADPDYWQMDTAKVYDFLTRECHWTGETLRNRTTRRRVRALLPVHILGHPVDLEPLLELAKRFDLAVVEDATECLGATYKGRQVGTLGHVGCFSFNGNKIITTGGGGMLVTADEAIATKSRYLSTQAKDDPIEYVHREIGYNYRLSSIAAALGCAQLELLDRFMTQKREIAAHYEDAFRDIPGLTLMRQAPWARSNWWLCTVRISPERFGRSSRELLALLGSRGIQARPLWQPMHLCPAHAGSQAYRCEVSEILNRQALSLPSSPSLSREDQKRVISCVLEAAVRVP